MENDLVKLPSEREHNKIEATVPIEYEIRDDQLGRASAEAVDEDPSAFIGHIGESAVIKMASVLWGDNPNNFMGQIIATSSDTGGLGLDVM